MQRSKSLSANIIKGECLGLRIAELIIWNSLKDFLEICIKLIGIRIFNVVHGYWSI